MNLEQALKLYEDNGPTYRGRTELVTATRVVHSYLRPEEIQNLALVYGNTRGESRGPFRAVIADVREKLVDRGALDAGV